MRRVSPLPRVDKGINIYLHKLTVLGSLAERTLLTVFNTTVTVTLKDTDNAFKDNAIDHSLSPSGQTTTPTLQQRKP